MPGLMCSLTVLHPSYCRCLFFLFEHFHKVSTVSLCMQCRLQLIKHAQTHTSCLLPTAHHSNSTHLCSFPRESPTVFFTSSFPGLNTCSFNPAKPKGIVVLWGFFSSPFIPKQSLDTSRAPFVLRRETKIH